MQYPMITILPPKATQVLNRVPWILYKELLVNPNKIITKSRIKQATMGIRDNDKHTLTNPNELHNEEVIEIMFEVTAIM